MTTEAQPAQVSAPTKLSMAARLILRVLASSPTRPMTVTELTAKTPCSHGTAYQITKKLTEAGLLTPYPAEYGVPRTFVISNLNLLTSPSSPFQDEPLQRLLADLEPKTWKEVCALLLAIVTNESITEGELILRSGCSPRTVADWLGYAEEHRLITDTVYPPNSFSAPKIYTIL
jgi:hypothetical protein